MTQALQKQIKQKIKNLLPKLKCAFHDSQTLTNFCSCKKCLLPLCPSCIKIHTIQHVNMKTDPSYQNLTDVLLSLNMDLKYFISTYEENHKLFTQIQQKIIDFKEEINSSIENLKKSIIDQVQIYFKTIVETTNNKISQMPYINHLKLYKSELKKSLLVIKNLQKNLLSGAMPGKSIIRSLIKYQSNNMQQNLTRFDTQSKQFTAKLQGNFCTLSIRQNLKESLMSYLTNIFKININQIPILQNNPQSISLVSKKLHTLVDNKVTEKSQQKNSLTNIMSKVIDKSQNKLNKTLTHGVSAATDKQNCKQESSYSSIARKIFNSNQKRSFINHSSQRKSLKVSNSFCQSQISYINADQNLQDQSYCYARQRNNSYHCAKQRRSTSKGKGLSLIQPNKLNINDPRQFNNTVRFSLSGIENMNLELGSSKTAYIHRRK